jgi:hypothetical protein
VDELAPGIGQVVVGDHWIRELGRAHHRVEERRRGEVGDGERLAREITARRDLVLEPVDRGDHLLTAVRG